jgi:hypothetical protein
MAGPRYERPECEKAASFTTNVCGDPKCGLHLFAYRHDDKPICEIVIGREQLNRLLNYIHDEGLDL